MRVNDGLEMFEFPVLMENGPAVIYPVVIWDNDNVIVVDTGLPGQLPQFKEAMKKINIPFGKINKIIITHHDMDHIGGLSSFLTELSQKPEVLAHEAEKPYIQAEIPPIRLSQIEISLSSLSGDRRKQMEELYNNYKATYMNYRAEVGRTLRDGEELPYCGGIEVIYTPGHTPGHISLYLKKSKTLIAGDVMNVENNTLVPAPIFTIIDKGLAAQSLRKLTKYNIERVICYHGGLYSKSDINKTIEKLLVAYE